MKIVHYDIDLCPGTGCKNKKSCRRFTIWQNTKNAIEGWWLEPTPDKCKNYLLTKPKSN
jgi:hypothetical protein